MAEASRIGERRKPSMAHLIMIFTLLLQLAGIVWGAASLNAKVDFGIAKIDKVEDKVDQLTADVSAVKTDVAVLKSDVSTLKAGRR